MPENRNGLTLLKSEDWMAVWLGFVIIAAVFLEALQRFFTRLWSL